MALNLKNAVAAKNAMLDALATYAGTSAKLRIYSGSQPASPDAAITGTLLVELVCSASAFAAAAVGGVLTANAIASAAAVASGTASHFRVWKSNGTTPVFDGTVGTATSDLIVDNTNIAIGQVVSVSSLTRTAGN